MKTLKPLALVLVLGGSPAMAIEEPAYEVVAETDDFEVRRYAPFVIAEVEVEGDFEDAGSTAFRTLFDYISGENEGAREVAMTAPVTQRPGEEIDMTAPVIQRPGEEIDMTAPVIQRPTTEAKTHRVSFVLPASYELATAPRPKDPKVTLREVPARLVAALEYSGTWSAENYREHETKLLEALGPAGYQAIAPPEFARYNSPFALWFLRRNEVLVEVRATEPDIARSSDGT